MPQLSNWASTTASQPVSHILDRVQHGWLPLTDKCARSIASGRTWSRRLHHHGLSLPPLRADVVGLVRWWRGGAATEPKWDSATNTGVPEAEEWLSHSVVVLIMSPPRPPERSEQR